MYYLERVPNEVDLARAVPAAIRSNYRLMVMAPLPFVGLRGIRRLGRTIVKLSRDPRRTDDYLPRFLGHVVLEPSLSAGKFSGWSIVDLVPRGLWGGVDLRPGDVVTTVNGMRIEREAEAFDAFQAVRQAAALEITYLRQNQPRTLRFTIVGAPSPSLPKAAPTADNAVAPPTAPSRSR